MIPGQLTDPGVNFASLHGLTPVTVHMSFSLPRGNFERRVTRSTIKVQYRATRVAEVTFLHVNRPQKLPWGKSSLHMLIINVQNKFPNKKFQDASEMGKRVNSFSVTICVKNKGIQRNS